MTAILGISAFYHDSAAALVVDGKIIAAAQEERFSRIKHDASFPTHAIRYCLSEAGIDESDLDFVGFYEKPLLKFDRLLETYLSFAPEGFHSFRRAIPNWVSEKLRLRWKIKRGLNRKYRRRIVFCTHHQSHAASAFFPSPFDDAAVLTMDGVGEWASTTLGYGTGNTITLTDELRFPHSLGLLYSAFTYYCGFRVNSGEYKLMGLAPYGKPRFKDLIEDKLIRINDDGSFELNLEYFGYCQSLRMTNKHFNRLFGRPPRTPEAPLEEFYQDVAASIQVVTEDIVLKTARTLYQKTGKDNLCLAGGVALNCVANGRLLREGPFKNLWIQPASGDAGGALGVALLIWHQLLRQPRSRSSVKAASADDSQRGSLLGPRYDGDQVASMLDQRSIPYQRFDDQERLNDYLVNLLADGMVVGRFSGRAEYGPRALGNRSIMGDPRITDMQSTMNLKIKFRESFRPFAPVVLADHARDYFDLEAGVESPYMLLVCDVKTTTLPAITHVDSSARVQTVDGKENPALARLLEAFYEKTGCPVLINTSFNVRGEPIVGTPDDALRCFLRTEMDAVVIENCVVEKKSLMLHRHPPPG
ncbi:carbamoyltransferase family protein [Roseiconus lacunae]|uniref:carbamoyltransferase family protein n=1 Tax=Roseiconus lacunae TaxID=2605694 RepID=UPI0011F2987F|nr:carbamoyltransferase [Roseiconus lacunae]